jgi:hypothetical protein
MPRFSVVRRGGLVSVDATPTVGHPPVGPPNAEARTVSSPTVGNCPLRYAGGSAAGTGGCGADGYADQDGSVWPKSTDRASGAAQAGIVSDHTTGVSPVNGLDAGGADAGVGNCPGVENT